MGKLGEMINHNQIELQQFFTMHPFSASEKRVYDSALKGIDFLRELYVKNNKTYERLATVCNVINNEERNLVVITGYRGCGKTNFLRLIKYIADGGTDLETLEDLERIELDYAQDIEDLKSLIQSDYEKSVEKIRNTFFGDMYGRDDAVKGKELVTYLTRLLSGKCKYINFDEGGMGREKPFSTKLFYSIRASIDCHEREGRLLEIVKMIDDFAVRNQWAIEENFEEIDFRTLKKFWIAVKDKLYSFERETFYDNFLDELKKLSLEQLLFVYTIWEYAEILTAGRSVESRKLIYLLDNIDIISDGTTDIFKNTMMGVWKFIWDARNVFHKIRENNKEEDKGFIDVYYKTKFIVAMRETTAMHISGHLRDKMRGIMDHFDMSSDTDKTMVMQRKIDLALELIKKKEIVSRGFITAIQCLDQLNSDRLFMRTLFQLFNNDYRTAVMCITTICIEHMEEVKKAISLINSDNASLVFGGRGTIYRLILDGFFEWNYFDAIGISSVNSKSSIGRIQQKHGYSCARIILTILCNKQAKNTERFFVNPEESVRLAALYLMVDKLMELDEFVTVIDGLYSLRNKRFWNHLVTFDNILTYSPDVIKSYIGVERPQTEETDIYIRATLAGQIFASTISVHFEYFASRYASASRSVSLFLLDKLDEREQWISMKKIVSDVYEAVEKCTETLELYNRNVMKKKDVEHYEDVLGSPYYYKQQFHEERIIHSHISYLEAYRSLLFKLNMSETRLSEANTFLLGMIQKYLDLLKYDRNNGYKKYRGLFFTANSKSLYNELNVCIEEIRQAPFIRNDISVTREYYRTHFKGKKCAFMIKHGEIEDEFS